MESSHSSSERSGIDLYYEAVQDLQARVIARQRALLEEVAAQMAQVISRSQRILVFGTGHSHMLMEEGFFRAGGLAAVVPIFSSGLMLHENPTLSSQLERTSGLAATLLSHYNPLADEMILVYSNSGVNQLPVEMAMEAKKCGLVVVSVSSLAYSKVAPLSTVGKRLHEVADYAIDNGGEPGDALISLPGLPWRVGPSSTIVNGLIWNCLVVETVRRLVSSGNDPAVFASLNMPGAAEYDRQLLDKWKKINPHL